MTLLYYGKSGSGGCFLIFCVHCGRSPYSGEEKDSGKMAFCFLRKLLLSSLDGGGGIRYDERNQRGSAQSERVVPRKEDRLCAAYHFTGQKNAPGQRQLCRCGGAAVSGAGVGTESVPSDAGL